MTWSQAQTDLEAELQKEDNASEVEIDGHRVRKRTVNEMAQLEDFIENKALDEAGGNPPIKRAGYRVQAFNNGNGLV